MAKEAGNTSTADDNRACSNGRSGENRCSNGIPSIESRVCSKKPLYHEYEQKGEKELL